MKDFKEHALFIGKVILGVVAGLMVYNWLKANMEAKKANATPVIPMTPAVTETVAA